MNERLALGCLLLAAFTYPAEATASPDPAYGHWTAVDAACSGCSPSVGTEHGARLLITPTEVLNPFAVDCQGVVAVVASGKIKMASNFLKQLRLPRNWNQASRASDRATSVRITCNGITNTRLTTIGTGTLIMPYEGGMYIRFSRTD